MSLGNRSRVSLGLSSFEQYAHLEELDKCIEESPRLATILGNDYFVKPDIIVYRDTLEDVEINTVGEIVDDRSSLLTSLRARNGGKYLLHADISAKWTMRSDRSQNTRTEALNLIRNRKGHLPHIVCVTAEPQPSRLASIALGTGDIDCVYHAFLYELKEALEKSVREEGKDEDALELLNMMIEGKRIKDISDLPLDLAV
ncbi:MAG: NgoMIV family type II restriction endonuclease [Candidatus Cryptobacteroides sp.]|nr:NgoMIV family type II restriction endonuclease [Candidatus Cryptobacteroides sp.]